MTEKLLWCIIYAVVSFALLLVASSIKDTRLRINGKLIYDSDGEEDDNRYELRLLLQFMAGFFAFLSGCSYGIYWALGGVLAVFLVSKMLCFLTDRTKSN